ncbi:MAG: hypothetical protein AAFZ65_15750, partial [Planctomycetota bacterium]
MPNDAESDALEADALEADALETGALGARPVDSGTAAAEPGPAPTRRRTLGWIAVVLGLGAAPLAFAGLIESTAVLGYAGLALGSSALVALGLRSDRARGDRGRSARWVRALGWASVIALGALVAAAPLDALRAELGPRLPASSSSLERPLALWALACAGLSALLAPYTK